MTACWRHGVIYQIYPRSFQDADGYEVRGRVMSLPDGRRMLATIHPSYILRIKGAADKAAQYRQLVADLKVCRKSLAGTARSKEPATPRKGTTERFPRRKNSR